MWLTLQKPRMSDSSKDSKKQNEKRKPMFFIFLSYLREGKIVLCQKRKLRGGTLAPHTHYLMISGEAHYTSGREMDINYISLHIMKKNSKEG